MQVVLAFLALTAIAGCETKIDKAKNKVNDVMAVTDIGMISTAILLHSQEHGAYPGPAPDSPITNHFSDVVTAIASTSEGIQGAFADVEKFVVRTGDEYKPATPQQLQDANVEKFYLDPWGNPYRYRNNSAATTKSPWMISPKRFDLWSSGPNGKDESANGRTEDSDDIGNWK